MDEYLGKETVYMTVDNLKTIMIYSDSLKMAMKSN